ncbi:hypothetical protein QQ991_01375 [Weizmannia coagulans]|jgi:hypothetical protein|nr:MULTISPECIES: hypothetical protein [Heyndrickxia]NWN94543.1 hypothetical protein [Bacillus sp. (in: firmicutes)]AEH54917.1 hypothetical protein BCO26_2861 [Heyndrickxia coagulans 2-6]AJO20945.1 hypothetical protein SB48_HM08orf00223 [Heyndrickxia coagulans]ATW81644.1 hypothetical protein CIW84_00675 [Heyndrickxia coagulans]AVD57669.1 hypothetical protein C3766_17270 [Heyndrickxia coagulans]
MGIFRLVMLYIINTYSTRGFLIKKVLKIKSTKKYILLSFLFEVFISVFLISIFNRIFLPDHKNILIGVALILTVGDQVKAVMTTRKMLDERYLVYHFSRYLGKNNNLMKKVILLDWMVSMVQSLTKIVPFGVFFYLHRMGTKYILIVILFELLLFCIHLLGKSLSYHKGFRIVLNLTTKALLCCFVYTVASIFMQIIYESRRNISTYGYKLKAITNLNNQAKEILLSSNLFIIFKNAALFVSHMHILTATLTVVLLFIISIIIFAFSKDTKEVYYQTPFFGFLYKTLNKEHYYTYADYYSLKANSKELLNNPFDLFITGELSVSTGISLASAPYIHNIIVTLIFMFFQLHIILKGAISTTSFIYKKIFKLEQECSMMEIFKIYELKKNGILFSKYELLKRTINIYLFCHLFLFFIATLFISFQQSLSFLILIPFFYAIKNEYVLYSLRTNYDVFVLLLSKSNPPKINRLNEFDGFSLIATANNVLSKLVTQFTILGLIIIAMFKFISGIYWLCPFLAIAFTLFGQVVYSNKDYKKIKQSCQ